MNPKKQSVACLEHFSHYLDSFCASPAYAFSPISQIVRAFQLSILPSLIGLHLACIFQLNCGVLLSLTLHLPNIAHSSWFHGAQFELPLAG